MMADPKCPYCGETMMDDSYTWHCPNCHSSSPVVIYEEKCQTMTEEEKKAYAREVALKPALPKWISVKERLPEVYGTYITFVRCPKGEWIETNIYEHREERWEHDCGYHTEDVTEFVTHWMPLPEPPEEEG